MKYILASASPRRQELLNLITANFEILPADIDESVPENIEAAYAPEYLANAKAKFVAKNNPESLVIGADTGVFLDGIMLGKPNSAADAADMLSRLSGRIHTVITGCALFYKGRHLSFSATTEVEFYRLTEREIEDYIASGEPMDKAGSYGIQGGGSLFVRKINGDYFNVVGLPVAELNRKIKTFLKIIEG